MDGGGDEALSRGNRTDMILDVDTGLDRVDLDCPGLGGRMRVMAVPTDGATALRRNGHVWIANELIWGGTCEN